MFIDYPVWLREGGSGRSSSSRECERRMKSKTHASNESREEIIRSVMCVAGFRTTGTRATLLDDGDDVCDRRRARAFDRLSR